MSEAKILFLCVLIHQWHCSLADCLIRCNQQPVDEHSTQFRFIATLMNDPSHAYTDHKIIVIICYFTCSHYYVHKVPA